MRYARARLTDKKRRMTSIEKPKRKLVAKKSRDSNGAGSPSSEENSVSGLHDPVNHSGLHSPQQGPSQPSRKQAATIMDYNDSDTSDDDGGNNDEADGAGADPDPNWYVSIDIRGHA
jgi:hypothetical protein